PGSYAAMDRFHRLRSPDLSLESDLFTAPPTRFPYAPLVDRTGRGAAPAPCSVERLATSRGTRSRATSARSPALVGYQRSRLQRRWTFASISPHSHARVTLAERIYGRPGYCHFKHCPGQHRAFNRSTHR